jgi:hypothetical protein
VEKRVQRPVGALARVCVGSSKPETIARRKNPPSELSRSLSRHNHVAAGGGHPIIELPCILYQTPRTLVVRFLYWWSGGLLRSAPASAKSLCSVSRRTWPAPVIIQEPVRISFRGVVLSCASTSKFVLRLELS